MSSSQIEILKEYYSIPKEDDPLDLDSKGFDWTQYMMKLLEEGNVATLLYTENRLSSEINQLEGEMKTLVYENYNRFILATQTITTMKHNIDEMEVEVKRLVDSMDKIIEQNDIVDMSLKDLENHLNEMRRKLSALDGLEVILKFPEYFAKIEDPSVAADEYSRFIQSSGTFQSAEGMEKILLETEIIVDQHCFALEKQLENGLHCRQILQISDSLQKFKRFDILKTVDRLECRLKNVTDEYHDREVSIHKQDEKLDLLNSFYLIEILELLKYRNMFERNSAFEGLLTNSIDEYFRLLTVISESIEISKDPETLQYAIEFFRKSHSHLVNTTLYDRTTSLVSTLICKILGRLLKVSVQTIDNGSYNSEILEQLKETLRRFLYSVNSFASSDLELPTFTKDIERVVCEFWHSVLVKCSDIEHTENEFSVCCLLARMRENMLANSFSFLQNESAQKSISEISEKFETLFKNIFEKSLKASKDTIEARMQSDFPNRDFQQSIKYLKSIYSQLESDCLFNYLKSETYTIGFIMNELVDYLLDRLLSLKLNFKSVDILEALRLSLLDFNVSRQNVEYKIERIKSKSSYVSE